MNIYVFFNNYKSLIKPLNPQIRTKRRDKE